MCVYLSFQVMLYCILSYILFSQQILMCHSNFMVCDQKCQPTSEFLLFLKIFLCLNIYYLFCANSFFTNAPPYSDCVVAVSEGVFVVVVVEIDSVSDSKLCFCFRLRLLFC
eukprot:464532_1